MTGKPSDHSISTALTELSKIAESASPSPKPEFSITSHPFYSSTASTGNNDKSMSRDYGNWGKPNDVGVKLAVNQALLYTVQVANSMAGKDDKKMECTKSWSLYYT